MARPTDTERAARLYAPVPIPVDNGLSMRSRCNVYVPRGTTAPWWVVRGRRAHGEHVEAEAYETQREAWDAISNRLGFVVDARVMFDDGRRRLDVVQGITVQHAAMGDLRRSNSIYTTPERDDE